ncbi:MAG: Lytic transglycosylase, catalytic [Acidobacteriales bacterium]|nr:Lytic transglycosylase, catalytic [Terriglobales bacterium]
MKSRVQPVFRSAKTAMLFVAVGVFAHSSQAFAGDRIVAVRENGRVVFVNDEAAAKTAPELNASVPVSSKRLVYWSNVEHRWKRVPPPSRTAMRNARSAAQEVAQIVSVSPRELTVSSTPIDPVAPDTRGLMSGHKITQAEVDAAIVAAAARHNVDVNLVRSIIKVESNFNPRAVSRKGAMGLMQLMPATARELNVRNPFDVNQNVDGGVRHFKGLLQNFGGDVRKSLAAYNAGAGAVTRNNGVPPYAETKAYVNRITQLYGQDNAITSVAANPIKTTRDSNGHLVFSNE